MTDYFALLEEPRRPWLDPEELKAKFHRLGAKHHPDVVGFGESGVDFALLNVAYQTLSDPKNRLRHLIELQFPEALPHKVAVPRQLADLFMDLGRVRQEVDAFLGRLEHASTPIAKAALATDQYRLVDEVGNWLDRLRELHAGVVENLKLLGPRDQAHLVEAYEDLSYLSKWIDQLKERLTRLSL